MFTEDHVHAYLRHLADDLHRSPSTLRGRRQELLLLVRRQLPLEQDAYAAFISRSEQDQPLAPTTRNLRLVIVRGFVRWLLEKGILQVDPTAGIERARVPKSSKVALGVDDIRRTIVVIRQERRTWSNIRDESIIALLFYTGLRVFELRNLDLGQIDLLSEVIRKAHRKGGGMVDVVLIPHAVAALQRWLQVRPASEEKAIFLGRYRKRLSVRMIQKRLREFGTMAGLSLPLHAHALRHAHATALLRAGVPVELIRLSLNHSSIATTQRYLHADEALLREALAKLPPISQNVRRFREQLPHMTRACLQSLATAELRR